MSDFFDDEIEENNNSHLLLADIEWSSQSDPFDISVDSFSLNIVNRLSGIDEDKFKEEVEMWQQVIGNLPAYNEAKLKNEMNAWDFTIPKHDKDAIATFTVQPFLHKVTVAKRCLTYLENVQKNIDFGAVQLERLMRERQNLARINQNFNSEGMSNYYNSAVETENPHGMLRKADQAGIKTRNNRL